MRGCRLLLVLIVLPLACGNALDGRLDDCSTRKIAVSVLTSDGNPVTDLSAEDFRAEISGKPVAVTSAVYHTGPRRTVIVLDTSGSMTNVPEVWRTSVAAAKDFLAAVPSSLELAFLAFSRRIHEKVDFGESKSMVQEKLLNVESTQWHRRKVRLGTALYDALDAAISLLQPANVGDSIFLITDGGESNSVRNLDRVRESLLEAGIRVFSLQIDTRYVRTGLKEEETEWIRQLVALTGGNLVTIFPNQRAVKGLSHMIQMMSEFYMLDVSTPTLNDRMRSWKVSVVSDKTGHRKISVSFARRLASCR